MNVRSIAMTLWDVLRPSEQQRNPIAPRSRPASHGSHTVSPRSRPSSPRARPIQAKYDAIVLTMKEAYGFKIRKWRSSMSGCAWELKDKQGNITRLLESPYPKGPMSCAIFLHEVGHHAIGFHVYKPRCLEEYYAWEWSFEAMKANDIRLTANVCKRREHALQYAVAKALRRGLKRVPIELEPFIPDQYRRMK